MRYYSQHEIKIEVFTSAHVAGDSSVHVIPNKIKMNEWMNDAFI